MKANNCELKNIYEMHNKLEKYYYFLSKKNEHVTQTELTPKRSCSDINMNIEDSIEAVNRKLSSCSSLCSSDAYLAK